MGIVAGIVRAFVAVVLLVALGHAVSSRIVPPYVTALGALALVAAAVRPELALPVVVLVAPWGARLAGVPVRATEIVLFAFFVGLCLHRPRRTEGPLPPCDRRALFSAAAFALVVVVSWMRTAAPLPAAPVAGPAMPDILRLVPADYLVTAGRSPHTAAALQALIGVALVLATRLLARRDAAFSRRALGAVAVSSLVTAVVSVVAVPVIYYTTGDYNEIERYIGSTPSRGAFHLQDVNAAASHYILSGLIALGLLPVVQRARWAWHVGLVMLVVALWMSGSRAASVTGVAMAVVWFGMRALAARGWVLPQMVAGKAGVAALVVLALLTGSGRLGRANAEVGSASRSLSIRGEFLDTSLRMFSTAPVLGVGVGTYYERSSAFMPPTLRALYGRENAHNYYMQVLAELGAVGLVAFLWWLGSALAPAWRAAVARPASEAFALCLGCAAYLLTCVTGHPFLVVEAAVPFWVALGVAAATGVTTTGGGRDPLAGGARTSG